MKKYLLLLGLVLGVSSFLQAYINQPQETDPVNDKNIDIICQVPSANPETSAPSAGQNAKSKIPLQNDRSDHNSIPKTSKHLQSNKKANRHHQKDD